MDVNIVIGRYMFDTEIPVAIAVGVRPRMMMFMMVIMVGGEMEGKLVRAPAYRYWVGPSAGDGSQGQGQSKQSDQNRL
jgi:hypothetical protein